MCVPRTQAMGSMAEPSRLKAFQAQRLVDHSRPKSALYMASQTNDPETTKMNVESQVH